MVPGHSWHNRASLKTAAGLSLLLLTALSACRSPVASGVPTDAGMEARPGDTGPAPFDAYCAPDAMGGGVCAINFCNQIKVSLPQNEFPQSGADAICNMGRVCVVGPELAAGDGYQLVCAQPNAGALPFGATCSPDPAAGMRCAADSLCIAYRDFPAAFFCSRLCRNDADCPTDSHGQSRCLEYPTPPLTNGSAANVGMCTSMAVIRGTPCLRERDCDANGGSRPTGEGCMLFGQRTELRTCKAGGAKSLGTACGGHAECRSGECYDRDFHVNGGGNRTYCSSACLVNSDCGPDQTCSRLVVSNNGTLDNPLDDVVSGYCRSMFPPLATGACQTDANCVARQNGSDTCDTAHGLCYRAAAVPGTACTADTGCPLDGVCSMGPRFPNGYCQTFGCGLTATTGRDSCPGTNSVCAQRGGPDEPIASCYEACQSGGNTCSRAAADNYTCQVAASGATFCVRAGT
jgi:hypothetical protein